MKLMYAVIKDLHLTLADHSNRQALEVYCLLQIEYTNCVFKSY